MEQNQQVSAESRSSYTEFSPENVHLTDAFFRGLNLCNSHFWTMLFGGFLWIITYILEGFFEGILEVVMTAGPSLTKILIKIGVVLGLYCLFIAPLFVGYAYAGLRLTEEKVVEFKHFFHGFNSFCILKTVAMTQLVMFIFGALSISPAFGLLGGFKLLQSSAGPYTPSTSVISLFLLFLLVGIIVFLAFYFWSYFAVAAGYNQFWRAMEISRKIGMKNFWSAAGFFLFAALLNIGISVVTCGIGTFYSIPATFCAGVCFFRQALGNREEDISILFE